MKKPYEEVKKLATQGPLQILPYLYTLNKPSRARIHGAEHEPVVDDCNPSYEDAALIAHHWNTYEELVEMLKRLRGSIRHSIACKAPHAHPCTCNANQLWEESEKVLAKAQQVEVEVGE